MHKYFQRSMLQNMEEKIPVSVRGQPASFEKLREYF